MRLGRGERQPRRRPHVPGGLLQRRQQREREQRRAEVIHLQARLEAARRRRPLELEHARIEQRDVEPRERGRAFADRQDGLEGLEVDVPNIDLGRR